MIIAQQIVAPDEKYVFSLTSSFASYDVHNDSPFNVAISFGTDTGFIGADYYLSPHTILYGAMADQGGSYVVSGRSAGQIYLYTQTPLGGGVTDPSTAPALQVSIVGYAAGHAPQSTIAMNRWQNIGNTVNSNVTTTQNTLVNDGSAPGTTIIESTPAGGTTSTVKFDNNGNANLAGTITGAGIVASANGFSAVDNTATVKPIIGFNTQNKTLIWLDGADFEIRNADASLALSYDPSTGQLLFNRSGFGLIGPSGFVALNTSIVNTHVNGTNSTTLQANGVDILDVLSTAVVCNQPIRLSQAGSISGLTIYSGTTAAGTAVSVAHGMGTTPDICITTINSSSSTTTYSTTWNATNAVVLANTGGIPFKGVAIKL
jgi:hypothetical protein